MSEDIDSPVWRRWRNQQKPRPDRRWSWSRFLLSCALAFGLGYIASAWISQPVLLGVIAIIVGALTLLVVFLEFGFLGMRGRTFISRAVPASIFIGLIVTNAPLKLEFALKRDEFDAVAARYAAGEKLDVPFTIGSWEIVEVNRGYDESGPVIFWESVGGAGGYEFVRHPAGHGVNTFGVVRLDDEWAWVLED